MPFSHNETVYGNKRIKLNRIKLNQIKNNRMYLTYIILHERNRLKRVYVV